jgi:hypothetical protein
MGSAFPLHSERSVESTSKHITSTAPVKFSATSSPTGLGDARCPLVIAAVAEIASLTVLHCDADFVHMAAMTRRPTQWIVERGSIDRSPPHDRCTDHLETSRITLRRIIAFDKPGPAHCGPCSVLGNHGATRWRLRSDPRQRVLQHVY